MSKKRKQKNNKKAVYNSRTDTFRLAGSNTPSASTVVHQTAESQTTADEPTDDKLNQWRNEPGVDEPLRVGRAIRTRDEFFMGQKGKNIHPEQHPKELYRRAAVLEIGKKSKLAVSVIKRPSSQNAELIPDDPNGRKYKKDIPTFDDEEHPIRLKEGKFELAPSGEDITPDQAQYILQKNEQEEINRGRMDEFRKAGATKRAKNARKKESNTD